MTCKKQHSHWQRFRPGKLHASKDVMALHGAFCPDFSLLVARHASGDWGSVTEQVRLENERALQHGGKLVSLFELGMYALQVITSPMRSYTTLSLVDSE